MPNRSSLNTILLCCLVVAPSLFSKSDNRYIITGGKIPELINQNAYIKLQEHLNANPELFRRLTDPKYIVPSQEWGYLDQYYPNKDTMLHLMSLQIKKMIELGEIKKWKALFDKQYGIGSKNHKDKGTIKNVFAITGHPVRREILQGSQASTLKVYNIFRKTIKNELKAYARSRSVEWHLMDVASKTQQTLEFLKTNHPDKTAKAQKELLNVKLSLETLIHRALESHLLS